MNKRLRILLLVAITLALIAALFGRSISRSITITILLRQAAPDPVAVQEVIASSPNPGSILQKFWDTQKIPHRYLSIAFIKNHLIASKAPIPGSSEILDAALADVDNSVRELAFGALSHFSPERRRPAILNLLNDKDSVLRVLAIQHAKEHDMGDLMPDMVELMDDPSPLVVASAAGLLRKWTGEDFGVRNHDAVAKSVPGDIRQVPPENRTRLRQGALAWKTWWRDFPNKPSPREPITPVPGPARLPTQDFELRSIDGELVRLSDFKGKIVLLNFWTTWCTACASEIPDLVEIQKRHKDELIILGISLDGSDGHGHDHAAFVDLEEANEKGWDAVEGLQEGDSQQHHDHGHDSPGVDLERIKKKIRRTITRKGLNYPILLNPSGSIGNRYNGQELPTNVLIDKAGYIRRRFIGSRPIETWEAMLEELR